MGICHFLVEFLGGTAVLGLGVYDLITRRRLHPACVAAASLGVASEILSAWLYVDPAGAARSLRIIGRRSGVLMPRPAISKYAAC